MKAGWPDVSLGEILSQDRMYIPEPEDRYYTKLSVKLYGKGVVPLPPVLGSSLKMKRHQIANEGQVILSEIWGKKGAVGIVPPTGDGALVTSHFFLFNIAEERVVREWLGYWFLGNYVEGQLAQFAKGSTGYAAVRPTHFFTTRVPLPPLFEQRRIVTTLNKVVSRTEEAHRLADQIEEEQAALLFRRVEELAKDAPRAPMAEVAPVVRHPVAIDPDAWYSELGVRSFGKGLFAKPKVQGCEWTWQRPYWMKAGDLLFSNIKAWEGAVAVVSKFFDDYVGSHRYITCQVDLERATPEFLCQWFLSPEGIAKLGGCSPGATDRNRTLGLKKLAAIEVPLPPIDRQREFGELLRRIQRARTIHQQTASSLEALMPALLDQAFRGEL